MAKVIRARAERGKRVREQEQGLVRRVMDGAFPHLTLCQRRREAEAQRRAERKARHDGLQNFEIEWIIL